MKRGVRLYPALLAAVVLSAAALFWLCWRYDNKYTYPGHPAGQGITALDMERYRENPFLYLVGGWELYRDRLLSPAELAGGGDTPDLHLYLGQYGGFDLGDPDAPVDGRGTYRMTVFTDALERDYALELTEIFTAWRLWVNGKLVQCVGMEPPAGEAPSPGPMMAVFRAKDRIEIVVEVVNDGGFYGGMIYPPAFGSPEAVGRRLLARLLIHAAACAFALLVGLLCLLAGLSLRRMRRGEPGVQPAAAQPYAGLFLLCACFFLSTAYPVFQALGLRGGALNALGQCGTYGAFLAASWLHARLCALPKRACLPICALGAAVCAASLVPVQRLARRAGALFLYSRVLEGYVWLTAAWLLLTAVWAVWRGRRSSRPLLAGFSILGSALVCDRLRPLHEPVLLGWNVELAGYLLILIVAGILWRETVRIHREGNRLREQKRLDDVQLAARREHAALQQDYLTRTRAQLHETRNHMMVLRHYAGRGETGKLSDYLDQLLADMAYSPASLTGHELIDAILGVQLSRARGAGIYVEHELGQVPPALAIEDAALASVLMNLLDNAIEANARLGGGAARWISLQLWYEEEEGLSIECINAAEPDGEPGTSKADKSAHGYGLRILRQAAERYEGSVELSRNADSFAAVVRMRPARREQKIETL